MDDALREADRRKDEFLATLAHGARAAKPTGPDPALPRDPRPF
jgi:hypothetical protein